MVRTTLPRATPKKPRPFSKLSQMPAACDRTESVLFARGRFSRMRAMPLDKSQLETVTLNETATGPLNETTLPQQDQLSGQLVDDRYFIEREVGQGGVGVVYLARDRKLHNKAVVV